MHRYFERAHAASELDFVPAGWSTRSVPAKASCRRGHRVQGHRAERHLGSGRLPAAHRAARRAARHGRDLGAGGTGRTRRDRGLGCAVRYRERNEPAGELAQRIARTVRRLVDEHEPVGIERRAARYGDVLILVRQRGELFEAIIRALKHEKVEVAGADRWCSPSISRSWT